MKTAFFIFAAGALALTSFAADITLNDGRVLSDATIVSQSPRNVSIKHAAGLSSVAKQLLPTELQAKYPYDEAAAREADARAIIAREKAQAFEKTEAERSAQVRKQREATAADYEARQAQEAADLKKKTQTVRATAATLAENYFNYDYVRTPTGENTCSVSISDVRPVEGWQGRWLVTGHATIRHYDNQNHYSNWSGAHASSQIGDPAWREGYNSNQPPPRSSQVTSEKPCVEPRHWNDVRPPEKDRNQTRQEKGRTHDYHRPDWNRDHYAPTYSYTSEIKAFEAYYTEGPKPTLDITLR